MRDRLRAVALAEAGRPDEQRILARLDELQRCKLQDGALRQPRVVAPVEVFQILALWES